MWNEEVLKGAMEELRGQRDALNLLVTVVQRWVKKLSTGSLTF